MTRPTVVAAAVLLGCTRTTPLPPSACRVDAPRTLATDPRAVPLALASFRGDTYALTVAPAGDHVTATVVRVHGAQTERVVAVDAPSRDAVAGFADTPDGPAFLVATADALVVRVVGPGSVREVPFPRGDVPHGRESLVPTVALAYAPDRGFNALAGFTSRFGTRRLHARDVGESLPYTPARQDVFTTPALALAGSTAVLVQQRHVGTFAARGEVSTQLEVLAFPTAPAAQHEPRPVPLTPAGPVVTSARVAPLDPASAEAGVAVVYRTAAGVSVVLATRDDATAPFRPWHAPVALDTDAAASNSAVASSAPDAIALPTPCGLLYAWLRATPTASALRVRRANAAQGDLRFATPDLNVDLGAPVERPVVRLARSGPRVVVAADTARGVAAYDVALDAACVPALRPLQLPPGAARGRLVDLAADGARIVLATRTPEGDEARVTFATLATDGTHAVPPARTVASDARALASLDEALVIAGRTPRGIGLTRFADREGDDDEDLVIRGSLGDEFVLAASGAHNRVWVAEAPRDPDDTLGPAYSVVLHSFIGILEDGPRTEVHTGVVPWADFGRFGLAATTVGGTTTWATAWSAGRPVAGECLPGVYVALFDPATDRVRPTAGAAREASPWPDAVPVLAAAERTCDDRLGVARWAGSRFALTLSGPRAGARMALGDAASGAVTTHPLGAPTARAPGLAHVGAGYAVAWLDGRTVAFRLMHADGSAEAAAATLAGDAATPVALDALPVTALGPRSFAVAYPATHGPRVARVECGPAR